jgi:hypothetical protein
MSDGIGRADISTGQTGNAVIDLFHHTKTFFRVQFEHFGRTDIDAEFASPARLLMDCYLK